METDNRVQLENELDALQEENVESWIQRCFEACDTRFESDWLSGMLELAYMQFPDNYEVRTACSKASVLEARRLAGEGDVKEAVRRLEQLLEADPYCTEGFELLEELTRPTESAPPQAAPPPPPPVAPPVAPPTQAAPPTPPPVAPVVAPPPQASPTDDDVLASFQVDEELLKPITAAVEIDLQPVAAPVEVHLPPVAPAAVTASGSGEAHVAPAAPPPAPPPTIVEAKSPAEKPWDHVWELPRLEGQAMDAQYLSAVAAMAEKMRAHGRPDAALRLLIDHREELHRSPAWTDQIKSTVLAWVNRLTQTQKGAVAAQVCQWGAAVVPEAQDLRELADDLRRRFGLPTPVLPPSDSNPWRARLEATPADTALLDEIHAQHRHDPDSLVMLFREVAVECQDSRHLLNLGWAYLKTGTPVLALVHTQRALKQAPTRRGYQLLADVYEQLGQPQLKEAALRSLQETAAP